MGPGYRSPVSSVLLTTLCFAIVLGSSCSAVSIDSADPVTTTSSLVVSAPTDLESNEPPATATTALSEATTTTETTLTLTTPPWLGSRVLPTTPSGFAEAQPTPAELIDRRLPSPDPLAPPADDAFSFTISELAGEPLQRSTWSSDCPVPAAQLSYLTVSFWGFDERPHTGELIVAADQAENIVEVFRQLHAARFPIEEMRIVEPADLIAAPTGDGNNTASFVCRSVTGGSRFSEHAYGLAIDINPFHNPYLRDELVIPELATSYGDREAVLPGMVSAGDDVVTAFEDIGWSWGGNWKSLKDYQHFSLNNR